MGEPTYWGPGMWFVIHKEAESVGSRERYSEFAEEMEQRVKSLPCSDCRDHATEYYNENPLGEYRPKKAQLWAWAFHNRINERKGKSAHLNKTIDMAASSPSRWGPGVWYSIHSEAQRVHDRPSHEAFSRMMQRRAASLPCEECVQHATAYLRAHPIGGFSRERAKRWAWEFHNAVNRRLRKPTVEYAHLDRIYGTKQVARDCNINDPACRAALSTRGSASRSPPVPLVYEKPPGSPPSTYIPRTRPPRTIIEPFWGAPPVTRPRNLASSSSKPRAYRSPPKIIPQPRRGRGRPFLFLGL